MKKKVKKSKPDILLFAIIFVAGLTLGYFIFSSSPQTKTYSPQGKVLVTQIVDGDTIVVENGSRIRLLGIDTPERGKDFYSEAKDFLIEKILYKEVNLEKDITDKDRYSRFLRYIWFEDEMINAEIVKKGLGIAQQYEPDTKYQELIAEAEQEAIKNKIKIWTNIE